MTEQTIALVTGANKGIGFATARRLAGLGWTVLVGARDAGRGATAAADIGGEPLVLDVTDDASVEAAAKEVQERHGRLDVLVNNAGIARVRAESDTGADDVAAIFATNVLGPVRVTRAFLPLLRRSVAPRVVMVGSGVGSLARATDPHMVTVPGLAYQSSKAALNMVARRFAVTLPEFRVNVADPGYTATDLNGHSGFQTVDEGSDAIVRLAQVGPDGPTGTFSDRSGPVPW